MTTLVQGAEAYQRTGIMTAGKIKTIILLLEKLRGEIPKINVQNPNPHSEETIKCHNIIAQLEMSLNFNEGEAVPFIFEVYELIHTAIYHVTPKSMRVALFLVTDLIETLNAKVKLG